MNNQNTFNSIVKKSILNKTGVDITDVHELESVRSLFFDKDEYPKILKKIKENRIEEIKEADVDIDGFREYLEIMKFTDQNGAVWITTIYDSDELWQDPEVIDIILFQ